VLTSVYGLERGTAGGMHLAGTFIRLLGPGDLNMSCILHDALSLMQLWRVRHNMPPLGQRSLQDLGRTQRGNDREADIPLSIGVVFKAELLIIVCKSQVFVFNSQGLVHDY
jgi:hypothetical protein